MISLQEFNKSKTAKGLVQKMFEARQVAHNRHLATKSYAEHEALGEFYEELLKTADDFAETYQGQYGLLGDMPLEVSPVEDIVQYLEDCARIFAAGRESLKKDAHLQNMVDELVSLTYKTLYKLRFLK